MNNLVLTLTEQEKEQFKKRYAAYQQPTNNPYVEGFFKMEGVSMTLYRSKKVVFQGEQALMFAQEWGYQVEKADRADMPSQEVAMIGTDEVGNGSYFGGLAVVASFVTPDDHAFLTSLGVDDSKRLTDKTICQIAPQLQKRIRHQALLLTPQKYNEVIAQGYNAVSVKVALHNQAIFLLLQKGVQPQHIVIDAFTSSKNYERYLAQEANRFPNPITLEQKAEGKYLAVAVSSIIARALFLENLTQLSQQIGYTLPSGAGAASDKVACHILDKYGMAGLEKTAKLHFANTKKAQALLSHHQ